MFNVEKIKVGMILTDVWRGTRITVTGIIPYNDSIHGRHIDPDGSSPTKVIETTNGWYSGTSGIYGGGNYAGAGELVHLELPSKALFQAVVKAESETFMLENLFETEAEAKTYASEHGFEYVCKGLSVRVPA